MTMIRTVNAILMLILLCACSYLIRREDISARIVNPTQESRAELRDAVSKALRGIPVTLADDALTRNNRLIIERKQHRDAVGNPIKGMETEMPRQFHLVKSNGRCILIYDADGSRMELKQALCEPLE